jgi:hypothetical protein
VGALGFSFAWVHGVLVLGSGGFVWKVAFGYVLFCGKWILHGIKNVPDTTVLVRRVQNESSVRKKRGFGAACPVLRNVPELD